MENFKCEEMIISTPYLISEHFKIISNHRKKLMDFWTRGTNRNPPEKKLAGIFGKFFWFYMVFNVPVILYEMLLYCR